MTSIATERTNTILFPLPMDMMKAFIGKQKDEES